MNPWDRFPFYPRAAKRPPPEHGIKVKKTGSTWWGQRWIEALETMSLGYSSRLARGRTYARAGRTHDLEVKAGRVTARVTGSRPTPYTVTLELVKLSDAAWNEAIGAMAEQARFSAALLTGQMPQSIDEAFRAAGASLFPAREADLSTECTCPDFANPCKHIAATHYVLGEAFDRDPFLLFELRGRTKEQVLASLRKARTGEAQPGVLEGSHPAGASSGVDEVANPRVSLGKVTPADYDRPREPLPALHLSFDAPIVHGAGLRQLGTPASWKANGSPAELLEPLVRAASEHARRLALAEQPLDLDRVNEKPVVSGTGKTAPAPAERPPRRRSTGKARSGRS